MATGKGPGQHWACESQGAMTGSGVDMAVAKVKAKAGWGVGL